MTRDEQIIEASHNYGKTLNEEAAFDYEDMKCAFKEGVKWADEHPNLESIWHDASEEPEDNSHILIRYNYLGTMEFKSYHVNYQCDFTWPELVDFQEIKCWAYVDDILPKGGKK